MKVNHSYTRRVLAPATIFLTLVTHSFGQIESNRTISFQGFVTDSLEIAIDTVVSMRFRLYEPFEGQVWTEFHPEVTVEDGVFGVGLGTITPLDPVEFRRSAELGISLNGGPEIVPRTPLRSAPYAMSLRGALRVQLVDDAVDNLSSDNIVGGFSYVHPDAVGTTISGGGNNDAFEWYNRAWGRLGTIAGGDGNEVGGESEEKIFPLTDSRAATVGGGRKNAAVGSYSTVPGGRLNKARGEYSFAAGFRAEADHAGSFVWADSAGTSNPFPSTGTNQFLVRASGGVGIGTNAPDEQLHILDSVGGTAIKLGGNGTAGPNGLVFDDDVAGSGVQLFWRSSPNRLILERSSLGTGNDGSDAFWYDRDDDHFMFDGTLGIGTDDPRAALTIQAADDATNGPTLYFRGSSSDQVESGRIRFVEATANPNWRGAYIHYDGSSNNDFHIGIHDADDASTASDVNVITIERNTGDLGIRRSNPSWSLHVGTDGTNGNGAHVTDGGDWTNGSSRTFKTGFEPIDERQILDRLASLPIEEWEYKDSDEGRHIGPVAEDFYEAFGLGSDDRYIGTTDAAGVSMAAIQGLYSLVKEQQAEIERLRQLIEGE